MPVLHLVCGVANTHRISANRWFSAALEVYVRRAYKAYNLLSVDYEEGDGLDDGDAPHAVTWRFKLGQAYAAPETPTLYELSCILMIGFLMFTSERGRISVKARSAT